MSLQVLRQLFQTFFNLQIQKSCHDIYLRKYGIFCSFEWCCNHILDKYLMILEIQFQIGIVLSLIKHRPVGRATAARAARWNWDRVRNMKWDTRKGKELQSNHGHTTALCSALNSAPRTTDSKSKKLYPKLEYVPSNLTGSPLNTKLAGSILNSGRFHYTDLPNKRACSLNIFHIFEDNFFVFKELFSENSVIMLVY